MNYIKKAGIIASTTVLSLVFMAVSASAQVRFSVQLGNGYHRPVYVQRYYTPYPYNGYYGNPYWNNSDRYYDRQELNSDERHLRSDENKYYSDGYVTPHEQENLYKDYNRIYNDRRRVRNDW